MDLKSLFKTLTPAGFRRLSRADRRRASLAVDLFRRTERLSQKDVASWRSAWQRAIDIENPKRSALYDVYTDVAIDPHLSGCIDQRKGFATRRDFRLLDRTGSEVQQATDLLHSEWFDEFVSLALDSRFYGHSLIQFGTPEVADGSLRFSSVELVPRRHVVPEFGVIIRDQNDDPAHGIPYRHGKLADWCVEVGRPFDLGLLLKCAPSALSKKNMLAFWDGFGEIFGMPIRVAKTASNDPKDIDRVEDMMARMGSAFYAVFPEGTDVEIKETSRGDAYNVYDQRINRANSEISKCILNQTMTIDSGSSLSQSEVHLEVLENVIANDEKFIKNIINNRLLPFMLRHGFPVEGLHFDWNPTPAYTPEQIKGVEQMLLDAGFDIDPDYFANKYSIPISGRTAPDPNRFFD